MYTFNREQLERLKPYEGQFRKAVYSGYVRGNSRREMAAIKEVYDEATRPHSDAIINETCNVCIYNFYRAVGEVYFNSLEQLKGEAGKDIPSGRKSAKASKKGQR